MFKVYYMVWSKYYVEGKIIKSEKANPGTLIILIIYSVSV